MVLEPGDEAPDFTLLDQHGEPFTLSRSVEQRKVWHLVFFYPKALTSGCTAQACGLRDVAAAVGGTAIVGISPDAPPLQARFDQKHGLGYPLLSDPDHAVADAYGVWGEKSMYGRKYMGIVRSAFLVDEEGRIASAWYKVSPVGTAANLLKARAG
jgi:thioredoxin-dependent peroxiredoxin